MSKTESKKSPPFAKAVSDFITSGLDAFLRDAASSESVISDAQDRLPPKVMVDARALLDGKGGLSYRDGLLIQLAWGLVSPDGYDHTQRGEGARSVSQAVGRANAARHIPKVNDAYENIAKNTPNLTRGNVAEFDDLLRWMNVSDRELRELLFRYAAATVASTARPVTPMPILRPTELTFARVTLFLDDLLSKASGGAHEQFAVAAFLGAVIDQFGLGGVGSLGVRTKHINASDLSSGTAADIQILRGGMIEEVFEVSANDWRQKLDQAVEAARKAGLARAHIIAHNDDTSELVEMLSETTVDVTVTDARTFLKSICMVLKPPAREDALRRLYGHLDRLQPNVALTNSYVELLRSHALTTE